MPGVNLIKLLQVQVTTVATVFSLKHNGYTCKSFIKLTPWLTPSADSGKLVSLLGMLI